MATYDPDVQLKLMSYDIFCLKKRSAREAGMCLFCSLSPIWTNNVLKSQQMTKQKTLSDSPNRYGKLIKRASGSMLERFYERISFITHHRVLETKRADERHTDDGIGDHFIRSSF